MSESFGPPQTFDGLRNWLRQRVGWFRGYFENPNHPLPSAYVVDIAAGTRQKTEEQQQAKELISLHLRAVIVVAHHCLDSLGVFGYPVWDCEPFEHERWWFFADVYLSKLLAFLVQAPAPGRGEEGNTGQHPRKGTIPNWPDLAKEIMAQAKAHKEALEKWAAAYFGHVPENLDSAIMRTFALKFGWTPEQFSHLTDGQVREYLEALLEEKRGEGEPASDQSGIKSVEVQALTPGQGEEGDAAGDQGRANGAEGADDQVDPGEGQRARPKGNRGRKQDTDPKQDKRIWDAWHSRGHESLEALGNAIGMTKREVRQALDRHRKRSK